MATKASSQPQQKEEPKTTAGGFPRFDPSAWVFTREQVEASQEMFGKIQDESFARARTTVEESATLIVESLSYANRLATEWRKLMIDSSRHAAGTFGG